MNRLPWMKFFPSAWLSDSALGRCSPATRGCWMDLLMVMADGDRSGRLTGTVAELARICRCSPDEMAAALLELRSAGVAEVSGLPEPVTNVTVSSVTSASHVTLGCGPVTVENRRMAREHKSRHGSALRMERMRAKRACYAESYGGEVRNQLNNPPSPPTKQPGPVTPPEPRQAGGRAGSEISEPQPRQEPQPPEAGLAGHGLEAEPQAPVAAESQPAEAQPHGHGEAQTQGVPEAGAQAPAPGQKPEPKAAQNNHPTEPLDTIPTEPQNTTEPRNTIPNPGWTSPPNGSWTKEDPMEDSTRAKPASQPAAQAAPEPPGFDERWQEFLRRFPAVERKAIGRHAIRERADAIGRPFDALLAQVAEVCEDEEAGRVKIERSPLALACSRLRSGRGLKNGTLGKVRLAMGLALPDTTAKKRDPEPLAASVAPSGPPPSKQQLQAALERLERAGQTAAAEQIRRMLERL